MLASPIFTTRWRWVAGRALALLRFMGGKKVPPQIQRMRSDDLLAAVFPEAAACQENISGDIAIPDHPLARETMKDALTEAMDVEGLKTVLADIASGKIRCIAVDTPVPSQFSHEILNANPYAYLDDAPLEERRARAVEMRRMLPEAVLSEIGRLDPAAIAEVREEAWPDVRDADELHDVLQELVAVPESGEASGAFAIIPRPVSAWSDDYFGELVRQAAPRARNSKARFTGSLRRKPRHFRVHVFQKRSSSSPLLEVETQQPSREDAIFACVTGWMAHLGPVTAPSLGAFPGSCGFRRRKMFASPGSRRNHLARPIHRLITRRHRMVRPPLARAHSPVDAWFFAQTDSTCNRSAIHALAAALAAPDARNKTPRASVEL